MKIDHYRKFLQTDIENKWQNLCLLCYYICAYIDLLSGTDYSWTVKGLHKTPLPLLKITEVSCQFSTSTFLTVFMHSKRLEKCVRYKEHHLALGAGAQGIAFVTSPLLHTMQGSGSCQALQLGSRWLQGESSVLGRQGYLGSRDMDAMRKAPPFSSVVYFAWSKTWVRPHKNHQGLLFWFCVVFCFL